MNKKIISSQKDKSNVSIMEKDIVFANADVIVNAANGWGYMGGRKAREGLLSGVSESLNLVTDGTMERYCLKKARRFKHIPSFVLGKPAGEIFTSPGFGLNCREVIHAVTMRTPGSRSREFIISILLSSVFEYCRKSGYTSVAMPLLGTGTGGLDEKQIYDTICESAKKYPELLICVYRLRSDRNK